jgi:hypothetical protein
MLTVLVVQVTALADAALHITPSPFTATAISSAT